MILPNIMASSLTDTTIEFVYSDNLWDESLDFLLNLITIKEIYDLFKVQAGINLEYLEKLRQSYLSIVQDSGKKIDKQKNATVIGKITQVINEIKQLN